MRKMALPLVLFDFTSERISVTSNASTSPRSVSVNSKSPRSTVGKRMFSSSDESPLRIHHHSPPPPTSMIATNAAAVIIISEPTRRATQRDAGVRLGSISKFLPNDIIHDSRQPAQCSVREAHKCNNEKRSKYRPRIGLVSGLINRNTPT